MVIDAARFATSTGVLAIALAVVGFAARADERALVDPCPTVPPAGWVLEIGHARASNEGQGIALAREMARDTLRDRICEGVSSSRCEYLTRHISPWGEGAWKPDTRSACASVAIETHLLDSVSSDFLALDQTLGELAVSLNEGSPHGVILHPPRWANGCSSGTIGAAVVALLRPKLRDADPSAITGDAPGGIPAHLNMTMILSGADLVLAPDLDSPDPESPIQVDSVRFPYDLLSESKPNPDVCYPVDALGLDATEVVGRDGLRVSLDLPTRDGVLCDGERIQSSADVNQDAKIGFFSVSRSGGAVYLWSASVETAGGASARLDLPPAIAYVDPSGGDERLLVAAMPALTPGLLASWDTPCELEGDALRTMLPDAAYSTATFSVEPADSSSCIGVHDLRTDLADRARTTAQTLPQCGGSP